ncbi:MAG TPA: hypothetical protein VF400_06115 [Anaeromyxobacteraceae bacterium]
MRFHLALALLTAAPLAAAASDSGPIQDNSFLIEEAYNQEPGVIQHISSFSQSLRTRAWTSSYTEEWPALGQTHQVSVTVNFAGLEAPGQQGLGDLALNYRWQAVGNGEAGVALAPRLTLLVPTGNADAGLGVGGTGIQVNLPLSVALSDRGTWHVNAGGTYVPSARAAAGGYGGLTSLAVGQSLVWLAHSRFNFLVEVLYTKTWLGTRGGREQTETLTLNPGIRAAVDVAGGLQIVPGVGVPIGLGPSRGEVGLLFYLSFEHPFRLAGPTVEHS